MQGIDSAAIGGAVLRSMRRAGALAAMALAHAVALSQALAPIGCPVFHCTPEATGVMNEALLPLPTVTTRNGGIGSMKAQGCSGDGQRLACLFMIDYTSGTGKGTLKVIDATTLQPIWGSAGAAGSYDLQPGTAALGQVPLVFSDGRIAAGDASVHVVYGRDGTKLASVPVSGQGRNLGITPVGPGVGVISQSDGVLTLVDLVAWKVLDTLVLRDPSNHARVALVSPSSGTTGVLYAIAGNPNTGRGLLYSVAVDAANGRLTQRSVFGFPGKSGATPVVLAPASTGYAANLVLLHVPSLDADQSPQNRLLGLLDGSSFGLGFGLAWAIPLAAPIEIAPTVDTTTRTLFFTYSADSHLHANSFLTGQPVADFDVRALSGLPTSMVLNGHLAASSAGAGFTLLLSAAVPTAQLQAGVGQFVLALSPWTSGVAWVRKAFPAPDAYTAAWNVAPSSSWTSWCPVVVGATSGLTRLCDF